MRIRLLPLISACVMAWTTAFAGAVTEEVLATRVRASSLPSAVVSAEGTTLGYLHPVGAKWMLKRNRTPNALYDAILPTSLCRLPGNDVGFIAREGAKYLVASTDFRGTLHDEVCGSAPVVSHTLGILYAVVRDGAQYYLTETGYRLQKQSAPYAQIRPDSIQCADHAQHSAFIASINEKWVVVKDGVAGPWFDDIGAMILTPSGKDWYCAAKRADGWRIYRNETPGQFTYDEIGPIAVRADGLGVVFPARVGQYWSLMYWGPLLPTDDAEGWTLRRHDGTPYQKYSKSLGRLGTIIAEYALATGFDDIRSPRIAPDNIHIACAGKRQGQWTTVVDGICGPWYTDVGAPVFHPQAQQFIFPVCHGRTWRVSGDAADSAGYDEIRHLRFDAQLQAMVYHAKRDAQWCLVTQGKPGPWFDDVHSLVGAPDGRHWAAAVRQGAKWSVYCGAAGPAYDGIVADSIRFDGQLQYHYLAYRYAGITQDGEKLADLYLVRSEVPAPPE